MANVNSSRQLTTYVDDFGRSYTALPFKINEFYANDPAFASQWSDRAVSVPCSPGRLFQTRRLIVTFLRVDDDLGPVYETIQMPVATKAEVLTTAQALIARSEVICIDYQGERWIRVPSSFLGAGNSYNANAIIPVSLSGTKLSGIITYTTDYNSAATSARYAIEAFPDDLSAIFLECVVGFSETGVCSDAVGLTTRRFVGKARKFFDGEVVPGTAVRSVPISDETPAGLIECLQSIADEFVCVGYEGERVRSLQNLIAAA